MHAYIQKTFDILFPPTHEDAIVRMLDAEHMATLFMPRRVGEYVALSHFTDETVRALIHEAKFHANTRAQKLLATLLTHYLKTESSPERIIIPIPLSGERLRERGYNQVSEVIHYARKTNPELQSHADLLIRIKNTRPQTETPRHERMHNVENAFAVKNQEKIRGAHIMLLDDVTTTGATLEAAKAALLPHSPASLTCVALAH